MAMQTGVSSSKVLILIGAGLTGSAILRHGRLSEVIAELQEVMKGIDKNDISSHYNGAVLASQIGQLAQEIRELALSRPVTIFNGESASNGSLASYIIPAAAVGAVGYCYMWWKGWTLSDAMFVTKRHMSNAVATVSKQLDQVSTALASTKRHLSQRLENLDYKVEEQKETSGFILNEVHNVKTDLSQIGFDLEEIQRMVSSLEGKVELLEDKQDVTNAGVWYLCQVAGCNKDGINSKLFENAAAKLHVECPRYPQDVSAKGLQFLTDEIDVPEIDCSKGNSKWQKNQYTKPSKNVLTKTSTLHRSYAHGLSLTEGLF